MATGSRLPRVCICEEYMGESLELHIPQLLCLVCQPRPAIGQRSAAGEPSSPGRAGKKRTSDLRAFAGARNWPRGDKLGTHSIRRWGRSGHS